MMRRFVSCFVLLFLIFSSKGGAQTKKGEDVLFLVYANRAERNMIDDIIYQSVTGNVKFMHNNTYILCDTAIYDEQNGLINAKGHIQILQNQTKLTGETLHYIQDRNLAQVRGERVELSDNKNNRLRTQFLDFNTKDSIGTFFAGGSMIDSSGNILESVIGNYFSKENLFTFERTVEMSTDTVLIKADSIHYKTDAKIATLFGNIHAWHTDGYLRASRGRYNRDIEYFHFSKNVYVVSNHQEVWADTLNFYRNSNSGTLYGNVQVMDTTQSVILLGDECHFREEPQKVLFTRNPVFVSYGKDQDNVIDTLFLSGDTLSLVTLPKYQVKGAEITAAERRLRYLDPKPVAPPDSSSTPPPPPFPLSDRSGRLSSSIPVSPIVTDSIQATPLLDTLKQATQTTDSLHIAIQTVDSLQIAIQTVDSLTMEPKDTTSIRFISAWNNVKVYRSNGQSVCDSLVYNSLDSTARLYNDPILWNDNTQFSADSIQFFFKNNQLKRSDFFSSAFIISQEDDARHFDQIKGNDMIGYFRENDVYRFDIIGGAEAVFCIREDDLVSSINKKVSTDMIILLHERKVQRISYRGTTKSTLYPIYDLTESEKLLSNFRWREEYRPKDRFSITTRIIRSSLINNFAEEPQPSFLYTLRYFPNHPLPVVIKK